MINHHPTTFKLTEGYMSYMVDRRLYGRQKLIWSTEVYIVGKSLYGRQKLIWSKEAYMVGIRLYGRHKHIWSAYIWYGDHICFCQGGCFWKGPRNNRTLRKGGLSINILYNLSPVISIRKVKDNDKRNSRIFSILILRRDFLHCCISIYCGAIMPDGQSASVIIITQQ